MAVVTGAIRTNLDAELYGTNPKVQRRVRVNPFLAGAVTPGSTLGPAPTVGQVLPR